MFKHMTVACVILSFAVINAQLDDELAAAYSDVNVADDEENGPYDDAFGAYGNEYDTYDDGDMADYTEEYLVNITFSAERLKELYTCLCLGTSQTCRIHYSVVGDTWDVYLIEKNGTFHVEDNLCKYYMCSHVAGSQRISCEQVEHRSEACDTGTIAQFFRFKTHDCCGSTCVGIFWSSVEEELSFVQNTSDIESCESNCLCPTGSEQAPRITKVTASPFSNETQIDTYIIHKTQTASKPSQVTTSISSLEDIISAVSLKKSNVSPTTSKNAGLADTGQNESQLTSNTTSGNDKIKITIVATVAAVASVVVVSCLVLLIVLMCKRKRRRKMTMNVYNNTTSESGSTAIVSSAPQLNHFSKAKVTESSPSHYPGLPTGNIPSTGMTIYEQSPKVPGVSRNGAKVLGNPDARIDNTNNLAKEEKQSKLGSAQETQIVAASNSSVDNQPKRVVGNSYVDIAGTNYNHCSRSPDKIKRGQNIGSANVKDMLNSDYQDSAGFVKDVYGSDIKGQLRKVERNKAITSSKEDVESRQPLLTWPQIKESVV